jgi:hypothetical protein
MSLRLARSLAAGVAVGCVHLLGAAAFAQSSSIENVLSEFHDRHGFPGDTAAIALPDGRLVRPRLACATSRARSGPPASTST